MPALLPGAPAVGVPSAFAASAPRTDQNGNGVRGILIGGPGSDRLSASNGRGHVSRSGSGRDQQ
jgi:hypothetical protein